MKISLIFGLALLSYHSLYAQAGQQEVDAQSWMIQNPQITSSLSSGSLEKAFGVEQALRMQSPSVAGSRNAGLALISSLILPGSGQALVNRQWVKSGVMAYAEVLAMYGYVKNATLGRDLEKHYWTYVETGWSAAKYAGFLVDYYNFYNPSNKMNYNDLATPGSNLAALIQSGKFPANARQEWPLIDLSKLRALEAKTLYGGSSGTAFSHNLPEYGSQQYYELVSKYFQFGPGWKDFNKAVNQVTWEKSGMSQAWFDGAAKSKRFNDRLRTARNMMSLVFVSHIFSGFDAMIAARLHNHKFQTSVSMLEGASLNVKVNF